MAYTVDDYCLTPCPQCGKKRVQIIYYRNDSLIHQHTHYFCTYWPTHGERCGWMGWFVPTAEDV